MIKKDLKYAAIEVMIKIFLSEEIYKTKKLVRGESIATFARLIDDTVNNPIFQDVIKFLLSEGILIYGENYGKMRTIKMDDRDKLEKLITEQEKTKLFMDFFEDIHDIVV